MSDARTIVFFPEGAYGPTNNCVGIGQVLRARGHRVVFIVEESFAGTLEAKGFEERLMRLGPPPEVPEAYRILFRSKLGVAEALAKMKAELGGNPDIDHFIDFVSQSKRGLTR